MKPPHQTRIARVGRQLVVCLALVPLTAIVPAGRVDAQSASGGPDSASAREALDREWIRIIDQCKRGDWVGIVAGFTPNGVYINPDWSDVAGHAALRAKFKKEVGPQRLVALTRHVTHFVVEGDLVFEGAESTEEWRTPGKPGTEKFALRYLYVWKRQPAGQWRILYLMETKPSPSPKTRA